jgi:hypothetical protein
MPAKRPAISFDTENLTDNELRLIVQTLGASRNITCPISKWDIGNRANNGRYHLGFFTDGTLELFTAVEIGGIAYQYNLQAYGTDFESFIAAFFTECRYWQAPSK